MRLTDKEKRMLAGEQGEAVKKASGEYGRFSEAVKTIDPRRE